MEFLSNLLIFVGIALIIVSLLLLFVFARVGYSLGRFKAHWKTTGDGAASGIIAFIVVLSLLAGAAFFANKAFAGEWFKYTEIYAGIDRTFKPSPQCERNSVDDRLTSNGGVRQHIYSVSDSISLLGNYTHHSCAVGVDASGYDAAGVQLNWRFDRR
jgi:hypothetical protein